MIQLFWFGNLNISTGQLIKPTELFAEEIRGIRELYLTQKIRPGLEQATKWRETKLQHSKYYVLLKQFSWLEFRNVHDYWTPIFRFQVKIAVEDPRGSINATIVNQAGQSQKRLKLFLEKPLVAEYKDFPSDKPRFYVDEERYKELPPSHEHHTIRDMGGHSWICYYGASGDWDPNRSTTTEAFTVSLDWLVMHNNKFGW